MKSESYHHVSPWKYVALSVITFGLYDLYWCYRCWKFIRAAEGTRIRPFWRAFFSPLWIYALSRRIYLGRKKVRGILLASAYLILSVPWELSDPYWLLNYLTFLPLLPLVIAVDLENKEHGVIGVQYKSFSLRLAFVCCLCAPITTLNFLSSFSIIPSTQVLEGDRLYSFHKDFFRDIGSLNEGEEVMYFYSAGFLSHEEDGNFFTDKRVVSYWKDPDSGEIYVDQAKYSEIESLVPEFTDSYFEDSIVTIIRKDETQFSLYVSNELGKDHTFCSELERRWTLAK